MSDILKHLPGPWANEPDYYEWSENGVDCVILRHSKKGCLNGYVRVYGKSWADVEGVYGGITYEGGHPREGCSRWIGFDCGHVEDLRPLEDHQAFWPMYTYRNFEFVKEQCVNIVKQLR